MAIVNCKECKKEVSNKAKKCPHCGVKNPGIGPKQQLGGCLFTVVIAIALAVWLGSGESETTSSHNKPTTQIDNLIAKGVISKFDTLLKQHIKDFQQLIKANMKKPEEEQKRLAKEFIHSDNKQKLSDEYNSYLAQECAKYDFDIENSTVDYYMPYLCKDGSSTLDALTRLFDQAMDMSMETEIESYESMSKDMLQQSTTEIAGVLEKHQQWLTKIEERTGR